jgi:hypothetical protein
MSNGRAPVRRFQIGFGPSGGTTAKWCQLGNTAHIPFPPMALLRLFICSPFRTPAQCR